MSTPATLKQIEQSRKRMEGRKKAAGNMGGNYYGYQPLSWSGRSGGYGYGQQYGSYGRPQGNRVSSAHIDFTDDLAVGRQYTSFEHKKPSKQGQGGAPRPPSAPKEKPVIKVEEAPDSVDCDELVIDDEKLVCFNGRQHWLSNLYHSPMTIEGHEYPSVEHYYQACKLYTLGDARLAMQIRRIPDAGNVKVAAKRLLREVVPADQVEQWKNTKGPLILKHAIVHKFVQNTQLREKLLATGDSLLAHTYDKDRMFATGCTKEKLVEWAKQNAGKTIKIPKSLTNETIVYVPLMGDGKNILGVISMQVREQVRQFQSTPREAADPILAAAMASLNLYSSGGDKPNAPDVIDPDDESATRNDDSANSSPSKSHIKSK